MLALIQCNLGVTFLLVTIIAISAIDNISTRVCRQMSSILEDMVTLSKLVETELNYLYDILINWRTPNSELRTISALT